MANPIAVLAGAKGQHVSYPNRFFLPPESGIAVLMDARVRKTITRIRTIPNAFVASHLCSQLSAEAF